ncbi:MAG: hypothetical protein K2M48_06400, partial [Clostridiales bacterium]|nr:hypothetical protein [Clostridiales bacterium]
VGWLFAYCILGLLAKGIRYVYFKALARSGRFTEKRHATVVRCAFESSANYQVGEFSRTHTIFKKFRVVATVDGKRSVGFVKGNVPPPRGATLKVLIRPNKPKKWIIDTGTA